MNVPSTSGYFSIPGLSLAGAIGKGAFGVVYCARHLILETDVAVKLIGQVTVEDLGVESLLREARLMARLDHPNLLRILDAGTISGGIYLVLELMDGGTCQSLANLPPKQGVGVLKQLLSAIQSLHAAKILHRDIKPANCLRRKQDGRIKLADLGLALEQSSLTDHRQVTGTAPFMAPELFLSPPKYSERSDLYALGMTAACLMLGEKPYPDTSLDELLEWARSGARPLVSELRRDVPQRVALMIDRMTDPVVERRPASASEALQAIIDAPASLLSSSLSGSTSSEEPETNGHADADTILFGEAIEPWHMGPEVYRSRNWEGRLVTHTMTAKPARLMRLLPSGKLAKASDFILSSAARAAELTHPSILAVLDWGLYENRAYVVTDDHGKTLESLAAGNAKIVETEALGFLWTLADALVWLHERGLVYQLIDPGAVVVGSDARTAVFRWPVYCIETDTPALSDDGFGRQVSAQLFAAPEVLNHSAKLIQTSVDVFGLGATVSYLLAGKKAYAKAWKSMPGKASAISLEDLRITGRTANLLRAMTAPSPVERPTSHEVVDRIAAIAAGLGFTLPSRHSVE